MKIAIFTIFRGNYNYGGMLQAYALSRTLQLMGHDAYQILFVGGRNPIYKSKIEQCKQYSLKEIILKILEKRVERKIYLIEDKIQKRKQLFDEFENHLIKKTKEYSINDMDQLGSDFDAFIVGSDQVWNPNVVNEFYFLDFKMNNNAKKISYAASIGRNYISKHEGKCFQQYLNRFDSISVREVSAQNLLKKVGVNVPIVTVLDPTMLVTAKEWNDVSQVRMIPGKYVLIYSFSSCSFQKEIKNYYESKGLKIVFIPYAKQKYNKFDNVSLFEAMWSVGPAEFLSLVKNAEFVITDSFHGAVFSIIFNKQFFVYNRDCENAKTSKNIRLRDLMNLFGLEDRMINRAVFNDNDMIEYKRVNDIMENLRNESISWLINALK